MKLIETDILGVVILESPIYRDDRGQFQETYNKRRFLELGCRSTGSRTTCLYLARTSSAGFTISSSSRRASWCGSSAERFSM